MTPAVRYPTNPITPHGAYHLLKGDQPMVALRSGDDTAVFHIMGPLSIPDRTTPESVQLTSIKGLIPPWKTIDQKGATQDGTTYIDTLYDPMEVEMHVSARGRNPQYTRQVLRDLLASIDAKNPSELSWFTPELGRWWAPLRFFKTPLDQFLGSQAKRQPLTLVMRADDGFWRSYDDVSQFRFGYTSAVDLFNYTTTSELGAGWDVAYSGSGTGIIKADGSQVVFTTVNGHTAVARRTGFSTATDNQVVEMDVGRFSQWYHSTDTYTDMWCRMTTSGTAGDNGVRLRIGHRSIRLSYFVSGVETLLRQINMIIPTLTGERYTLIAGIEGDPRVFRLLRNGANVFTVKESGTGSPLGATHRGVGFGGRADGTTVPPTIRAWGTGDNTTVTQTGFVSQTNVGDQPMWTRYTCFGPGKFSFTNGPNSSDVVTFGPLLANQVVQIRTDPRLRGVVDLTSTPPTPQQLDLWKEVLKDFISFATGNNVPPLLQAIESWFGISPPQGNLYSLLHGRFSDVAAIPPKPAGLPAPTNYIKVTIDDGTADSAIIAAGTPRRRMPY